MKKIKKIYKEIGLVGGLIYDIVNNKKIKADILIKDGKINKIGKLKDKSIEIIDCKDKVITPAFTDIHSHFRQPGREDKETIESGCLSALAGGYTRVCTMPNTDPVIDTPELIKFIKDESKKLPIKVYPIGAITKGQKGKELSEIYQMYKAGAIAISDDGIPLENSKLMRYALEYCKMIDIPVINHAEDVYLCSGGLMNEGVMSTKLGLLGNPGISESIMVFRDLSIAELTDAKIHIPHVSSEKTVKIIENFKQKGLKVTAEVTPHHLVLTDNILKKYNTNAKVAPPIRTEKDRLALVKGLKTGVIDCISTDHAPHTIEEKDVDFELASCGMIGLETAFSLVYKEMIEAGSSFIDILKWFTINPNKIMGLANFNFGFDSLAELNIIDLNKKWKFTQDHIYSKSINTPFLDKELTGYITQTISNGYIFSNHKD